MEKNHRQENYVRLKCAWETFSPTQLDKEAHQLEETGV